MGLPLRVPARLKVIGRSWGAGERKRAELLVAQEYSPVWYLTKELLNAVDPKGI